MSYRFNEANQLCWSAAGTPSGPPACNAPPSGATSYQHDAQGNLVAKGSTSFAFNAGSQLASAGGSAREYAGAGHGERIQAGTVASTNDPLGLASTTSGGVPTHYTRSDVGSTVSQRTPTAASPHRRLYRLADGLGSTRTLVNETGSVARRYEYDPYGRDRNTTGPGPDTRLRYAGGELDDAGQYHFGARHYDPSIQRWTQRDPLSGCSGRSAVGRIRDVAALGEEVFAGTPYTYASGSPVTLVDASGLWPCRSLCARAASVQAYEVCQSQLFSGLDPTAGLTFLGCYGIHYRFYYRACVRKFC